MDRRGFIQKIIGSLLAALGFTQVPQALAITDRYRLGGYSFVLDGVDFTKSKRGVLLRINGEWQDVSKEEMKSTWFDVFYIGKTKYVRETDGKTKWVIVGQSNGPYELGPSGGSLEFQLK